ncbi:MAG: D-alanyl-D-alanine carboxypeptidase (penicillin-binding protein 5/6) [Rickettsiales bacterium]|jgi:D-alanyl-D-alanine carboxypeptidase (penicillin-binding protein 5/6)
MTTKKNLNNFFKSKILPILKSVTPALGSSLKMSIATSLVTIFFCQSSFASDGKYANVAAANYLFLIDQDTKEIFLEKNADDRIAPSSMTKLMTAYVIFSLVREGKINLFDQCLIGRDAWKKTGSKMFLNYGDVVSIDKLLSGLLIVSGNDAAVALAQAASGSIDGFAQLMNETAKKIGLKDSNFENPHGLNQNNHYMSLRDLALLTTRIIDDFPEYSYYFLEDKFTYQDISRSNYNPLIKYGYRGATGMKTGYTSKGGFGMVGTATRGGRRLIAITNEAESSKQRNKIIVELLDYGFDNFVKINIPSKNKIIAKSSVWLGKKNKVSLGTKHNIVITVPKYSLKGLKFIAKYKSPLYAPIAKDQKVGILIVESAGKKIHEIPLFALEKIDKDDYFDRIYQITKYKFHQFLTIIKN